MPEATGGGEATESSLARRPVHQRDEDMFSHQLALLLAIFDREGIAISTASAGGLEKRGPRSPRKKETKEADTRMVGSVVHRERVIRAESKGGKKKKKEASFRRRQLSPGPPLLTFHGCWTSRMPRCSQTHVDVLRMPVGSAVQCPIQRRHSAGSRRATRHRRPGRRRPTSRRP